MLKQTILPILASVLMLAACSQGGDRGGRTASGAAAALNTDRTYIVATDASYAPMEYMENDRVVGFSRDILHAAAASQNLKLEFVNVPFEGIFANVDKGDSDIALASITISDERKQQVDFSDPYFQATQMIVLPAKNAETIRSFADLKNHAVSVQAATSGDLIMQNLQGKDSQNIKRFEVMPLAFKELENRGVDAVVGDSSVVSYYVQQHPDAGLVTLVDPAFEKELYGFAFKKGRSDGLRETVNKGLHQIQSDGTYAKISEEWFGSAGQEAAASGAK